MNRRLVKLHSTNPKEFIYKVQNHYADEERDLFFISDVPHLQKTVRNCWASTSRTLWVCIIPLLYIEYALATNFIFVLVQWKLHLMEPPEGSLCV